MVTKVDEYDFGSGAPPASPSRRTTTTYNAINRPSSVTVTNGATTTLAHTAYTYDESTATATTGTPQHIAVANSLRGNVTTITSDVTASTSLARHFTYYDTGNVNTATDVNSAVTTYKYASGTSCGNSFVTEIDLPLTLKRFMTWDSPTCAGAVMKTFQDENNNITTYGYTDPHYWRVTSVTDPLSNVTSISYPTANSIRSSLTFNSGNSVVEVRATVDDFGRPRLTQRLQGPGLTTYDTVQTDFDSQGRASKGYLPFSAALNTTCTGTCPGSTLSYDPLSRATSAADAGTGSVTYDYTPNSTSENANLLIAVGPAPVGETQKQRQLQFDGLGRLSSVCELTSGTGSGTCGQTTAQTGFYTTYNYDALGRLLGVSQNAQSTKPQGRSFSYDRLGRMTSETNPETGTTNYTYDSAVGCTGTFYGDLVKRVDAQGNSACYTYDSLHRVLTVSYSGPYSANTPTKTFVYDTATVNGVAMANGKGRLVEAYTGPVATKATDLGFSYTVRGELADVYQSTQHSSGYRKVSALYWANGAVNKVQNLTGLPTITYGLDGEGRTKTVSASTGQNPVTNTLYNAAGRVTEVDLGSLDKDTFSYDPNTGRMSQFKAFVGTPTVTSSLTWNPNGTLKTLGITDGLNSANTQTCNYTYDDLTRVKTANCGTPWNQTFTFDPFGNISKSGTSAFAAAYLLGDGSTNNRIQSLPGVTVTYDSNGNVTSDGTFSYAWDAEGRPAQIGTTTLTYDALGRMMEKQVGSTYTQIVYSPIGGKLALMNGSTLSKAFVPLPGGGAAVYTSTGLAYYRHSDWLGSSRVASTPTRTKYYDVAYAPYGESYAGSGTTDLSFTGQGQDSATGHFDFLFRKYNPVHGRWISPDPAGLMAASVINPQSWNRYAYVSNNPLGAIDPWGLADCDDVEYQETDTNCGHGGTGGGGGQENPWDSSIGDPWSGIFDASNGGVLHPQDISNYLNDFDARITFGYHYFDLPGKGDEFQRNEMRFDLLRTTGYDPQSNVLYLDNLPQELDGGTLADNLRYLGLLALTTTSGGPDPVAVRDSMLTFILMRFRDIDNEARRKSQNMSICLAKSIGGPAVKVGKAGAIFAALKTGTWQGAAEGAAFGTMGGAVNSIISMDWWNECVAL